MAGTIVYGGTFGLPASNTGQYTQTYKASGGTYSLYISPINQTNYAFTTAATATAAPAPPPAAPVSVAPSVPEPSLAGQTWGWPIPITAGRRTIPGRPVETRLTKGGDGHYIMDTLVSFGWRAEIMAGHAPLALTIRKLLINGVVAFDAESGFTAPGVSLTFYDGTQLTADPFWEGIHGSGNMPAHVYHILVNVVGLPLAEFKDSKPDAWALDVLDAAVLPEVIYPNTGGQVFGGSGFFGHLMLDAAHNRLWGGVNTSPGSSARLEEWDTVAQDSIAEHALAPYPGGTPSGGYDMSAPRLPVSGHFAFSLPTTGFVDGVCIGIVDPATDTFTDSIVLSPGGIFYYTCNSIAITGGGTRDVILAAVNGSFLTFEDHAYLLDYDGATLVQRYETATGSLGGTAVMGSEVIAGATHTDSADFYMGLRLGGGQDVEIARIVATYSDSTTATLASAFIVQYSGENPSGWAYAPDEDALIVLTNDGAGTYKLRRYTPAGAVVWESDTITPAIEIALRANVGSVVRERVLIADSVTIYAVDIATGVITQYPMPTDNIWVDESWGSLPTNFSGPGYQLATFDGPAGKIWITHASSDLGRNVVVEYDLGSTSSAEQITLARWFTLLGDLTYDLKGRVSVAANITETIDSLFLVDGQTTFNRDAMAMCRATGCDLRENNQGIEIIRGVDGVTYSVDLAVPERRLLRSSGESALSFSRVGEQNLPSEIRLQAIASEESFKFTERPARVERGPKPVTTSTRVDSIRIQAGMPINQIQTYASRTLDRETEARDQVTYKLPWQDAISVQPGDIHTVPEGDVLHTLKVTTAQREANRIVGIQAIRLHTAQDYVGVSDAGTGYTSFVPMSATGTLVGSVTPVGAFSGAFSEAGSASGTITGSVTPTGSFSGTFTAPAGATGTLVGSVTPTGSLSGTFTPLPVTGTLVGSVTPEGSFAGEFIPHEVTGTLVGSVTPTGSFAGTFTPELVTGTLAGTVAPTGSFSGAFTAAPWTPADLSSSVLKAWYKADDAGSITSSSGAVSQWNDKSGNANHVTQSSAGLKPTTGTQTINSKNVLDFDGGDSLSKTSGTSLPDNSPGFTIVVVAKYDSASTAGFLVFPTNAAASDFSWSFGRNGTNNMGIRGYQGTPANQAAFNDNTATTQLLSGIATTTLRQIWQHGTSKATNSSTDSANTAGRIYIGSDNNPTGFLDGKIAEIIIIEGTDQTTREKAEGYLAWEWGTVSSLDAGHPYKSAPP